MTMGKEGSRHHHDPSGDVSVSPSLFHERARGNKGRRVLSCVGSRACVLVGLMGPGLARGQCRLWLVDDQQGGGGLELEQSKCFLLHHVQKTTR